jgi:hypothetical protein
MTPITGEDDGTRECARMSILVAEIDERRRSKEADSPTSQGRVGERGPSPTDDNPREKIRANHAFLFSPEEAPRRCKRHGGKPKGETKPTVRSEMCKVSPLTTIHDRCP